MSDTPPEGARPVPGFPGYWIIAGTDERPEGVVWTRKPCYPKDPVCWREVKQSRGNRGHRSVYVHDTKGFGSTVGVHRLVYLAHVGPIPRKYYVRHLDDNPLNNRVSNLATGTGLDNYLDMLVNSGCHSKQEQATLEKFRGRRAA